MNEHKEQECIYCRRKFSEDYFAPEKLGDGIIVCHACGEKMDRIKLDLDREEL